MSDVPRVDLPTLYQSYIHQTRYARWDDDRGRRETWSESVDRYVTWFREQCIKQGHEVPDEQVEAIREGITSLSAMPSMRAFMTAGKALAKDNVAGYNCAYITIDHPRAFDEAMYILMCGTGIGFSVERQYIAKLPDIPEELYECDTIISVRDSRVGWASGYKQLLHLLWSGHVPKWDLSKLRPAGARLKTFGGRSSGPGPLDEMFKFTIDMFQDARGRKLTSYECHSLMCKIGDVVVSGGVRRSALISLSNPSDERMRDAKSGQWWETDPHFALANNSAVWTDKPDPGRFLDEWTALYKSKSGERGIINRNALQDQASRYDRRDPDIDYGVNPCSEIILRPMQFCNLTTTVVRPDDSLDDILRKVELTTIMASVQSTLTDFRYLRPIWKRNCEEERLQGNSLTGLSSHPVIGTTSEESGEWYDAMYQRHRETAEKWADLLGIDPPAAGTCVKPEGTASQLTGSDGSGMHRPYGEKYLRRTRDSKMDPVAELLRLEGVPCEEDAMKPDNWVFTWALESPPDVPTQQNEHALDQLKMWLHINEHWCDHKPSITVNYREDEVIDVGAFVYDNFDKISGVSFLPRSNSIYTQAPFEIVDDETYDQVVDETPDSIDWGMLPSLEEDDETRSSKELACTALGCDI